MRRVWSKQLTTFVLWASVIILYCFLPESLKAEIPSIETICVDLSNWAATKTAVEQASPIDMLVNNAGVGIILSLEDVTEELIDQYV